MDLHVRLTGTSVLLTPVLSLNSSLTALLSLVQLQAPLWAFQALQEGPKSDQSCVSLKPVTIDKATTPL